MMGIIANVLLFTSYFLNARKNRLCWPVSIAANIAWVVVGLQVGSYALIVANLGLMGVGIYGWRKWKTL